MREIIFDTETTGLDPAEGHRLVEIGCVELVNRVDTGRTFHVYINPGRPMPREAEAVHGLSDAFLADKPPFEAVVDEFLAFLGDDAQLIAHNAGFDLRFINAELNGCGRAAIAESRIVDTLAIARTRLPGAKHTLDALCSRFGVDRSNRVKHGALLDAQLLSQVYVELMGGRQIGLALAVETVAAAVTVTAPRRYREPRPHAATEAEVAAHAAFVAKLKDPLWLQP